MKVAVVGVGSIGKRHVANLRALGHEAVVVDMAPPVFTWALDAGYETWLAADGLPANIQAVIIATPASSHRDWLEDCDARGVPVLVEKPLGTVADLPALRALRPTAPVMVGYQLRFHPEVRRIQPLLSTAAAGILQCRCDSRTWPGSAGQGDFLGEYSHEIDLALACGAPPVVSYAASNDHDVELRLGSFQVSLADRSDGYLRRWEIYDQPRGSYDVQYHSVEEYDADATVMYRDELAHFLRAVEGGPIAPGCTLEEGIAVLEVIEQVKGRTA